MQLHKELRRYGFWEVALVLAFLFAMPMRVFFPTSFIIEFSTIVLFFLVPRWPQSRVRKNKEFGHLFFLLILFILGVLMGSTSPPFFSESYRYFTFFLFLTVLKISKVNYDNILRLCFCLCIFCAVFSIYELVYLNFINYGDYAGVPIIGRASESMYTDEKSDYLSPQWFLGIPYYRPMGFFIQPQKSGFINVIGTIAAYLIFRKKEEREKAIFWYFFFTVVVFISAAKTAVVSQFLILMIAFFNLYPKGHFTLKEIRKIIVLFIPLLLYLINKFLEPSHSKESFYILSDIMAFFNYSPISWLIGIGIPKEADLLAHGYTCECYIARLLAQVGIIFFILELFWGFSLIRSKSKKFNWIIIALLFGLFSHYCVINAYFMTFSLAVIICYAQRLSKQDLE